MMLSPAKSARKMHPRLRTAIAREREAQSRRDSAAFSDTFEIVFGFRPEFTTLSPGRFSAYDELWRIQYPSLIVLRGAEEHVITTAQDMENLYG